MSFGLALRGYNPRQVDDVLHQIATALERRAPIDPSTFPTTFEVVDAGYACDDVDQYLAAVFGELGRRADAAAIVSAHRAGNLATDERQESGEFLQSPLAQAAALLVSESVIEAQTDRGDTLEIWTISHHDALVSASAPRLAVSAGLQLRYRAVTDTGPTYIHGIVETAEYQSTARAAITIRVTDVSPATTTRRHTRLSLATAATLRATICDRIVPDEVLPVTLVDLSQTPRRHHHRSPRPGARPTVAVRPLP
jgi:DivIVA domain-containing protein